MNIALALERNAKTEPGRPALGRLLAQVYIQRESPVAITTLSRSLVVAVEDKFA